MAAPPTLADTLKRLWRRIPYPSLRSRAVLLLAPVHLLAFVALYFAMVHIVRNEILQTHRESARLMLSEAVRDLQPVMCSADRGAIPTQVGAFAKSHALLALHIYRDDGSPLGGSAGPDAAVRTFLASTDEDRFRFSRGAGLVSLQGTMRIRSRDACTQCHAQGKALGAATMSLDLTSQVVAAESHLRRNLVGLTIGWILVVGLVNIGLLSWTRRSLRLMEAGLPSASGAGGPVDPPPAPPLFDPVAAEVYASLSQLIRERRERKEAVEDRLHRTDRLASLGQLAAGLAHEIKNPLAGIRGVIELLRDETVDDERRGLFEQMVGELDRVNGTIHSLLNFARPVPPNRAPVDVRSLIEDSMQLLRPSLAQRAIDLTVEVARDVGRFSLDAGQIRQVLTNLVTNAAEAIEHDGSIVVRASRFPEGSGLIIAVQDDGPGIPSEVKVELFEPFFTTKFSGTGLGLAVVKSLVQQHDGRVEVQSELGRGSSFFVLLPERADGATGEASMPTARG
jgi:signal transduction histidine kinase